MGKLEAPVMRQHLSSGFMMWHSMRGACTVTQTSWRRWRLLLS